MRAFVGSRGNPTVMAEVTLDDDSVGSACAPSGASTGTREALELRDGDAARYLGKGVLTAVGHANGPIRGLLVGQDALDQAVNRRMIEADGTDNKAHLVPMPFWLSRWRPQSRCSVSAKTALSTYCRARDARLCPCLCR